MLKNKSLLFARLIMAIMMVILLPLSSLTIYASSSNVTKKMSKNSNFKKIVKEMTTYTSALLLDDQEEVSTVKIEMNDLSKICISAFVRFEFKNDESYTVSELKTTSKNLFGKAINVKNVKLTKKSFLYKNASKNSIYYYNGGEFGDVIPTYKISKVLKTGKNRYEVTVKNQYKIYGEKGTYNIGETVIVLNKSSRSSYGYIVKSIEYTLK